jgi:uncharacterized protein YjbI with pentapeptide repeats
MATGERVRFEHCDLSNADLTECRFPEAQLLDCRLASTDVTTATLTGAELHGSDLAGIRGVLALREAVIDPLQVTMLAHALLAAHGITVTDEATST